MTALDLRWQYRPIMTTGVGFATGNVWSRAVRRKQQQQKHSLDPDGTNNHLPSEVDGEVKSLFGFKVTLQQETNSGATVKVRWLQGRDSVLFESFCGMLKRQLSAT